jgi:hypothetical protein
MNSSSEGKSDVKFSPPMAENLFQNIKNLGNEYWEGWIRTIIDSFPARNASRSDAGEKGRCPTRLQRYATIFKITFQHFM